jgi:hypothetical protein
MKGTARGFARLTSAKGSGIMRPEKTSPAVPLASIQPDDYPRLSREGLGALKFNWRKANVVDDWTKGGWLSDAWDRVSGWPYWKKPSYDIDYGMRVLAKIAQEIPAWREIVGQAAHKYTGRMPQYAAWFDWVEEVGQDPNRGNYSYLTYRALIPPGYAGVYNSPGYVGNGIQTHLHELEASLAIMARPKPRATHPYYPEWKAVGRKFNPDPVYANGSSNMMYKGYYAHQLMLGYSMTGDPEFLKTQQLIYDDEIQFHYSAGDMIRVLCEQHLGTVDENGSPLLHDVMFGSSYRAGYDRWLEWAKENVTGGHDEPDGPFSWCAPYFDRDIPYCMSEPHQQLGPFFIGTAMQVLPNEPRWSARIYEGMFKTLGREDNDGLYVVWPLEVTGNAFGELPDRISTSGALTYAREVGDVERIEGLESWMAKNGGASYDNGEFYFTYGFDEAWPRGIPNAWATLGYIGGPGSLRRMYNEPDLEKFNQPTLCGVDYPAVNVSRATYDAEKDALVVTVEPGTGRVGGMTTFRVTNYPFGDVKHEVLMDGAAYDDWSDAGPGEIVVRATIAPHTIVIR